MVELSEKYSNTVNNDLDIWSNYSVCSHRHARATNSYGLKGADNTYELNIDQWRRTKLVKLSGQSWNVL